MSQIRRMHHVFALVEGGDLRALQAELGGSQGLSVHITRSQDGFGLLHMAAKKSYPKIVAWLLGRGANPLLRAKDGETALLLAIENRDDATFDLLLPGSTPLLNQRTQDKDDWGPLWAALGCMYAHGVHQLLRAGADPTIVESDGASILDVANAQADLPRSRLLHEALALHAATSLEASTQAVSTAHPRRAL